jgi:iron(III) transport system substrate-binding protein
LALAYPDGSPTARAASTTWDLGNEAEAKAVKEARVVIYAAPGHVSREAQTAIDQVFRAKYKIGIDWTTMNPQDIVPRVMAERRTRQHIVDIAMSGIGGAYGQLKSAGHVAPILAPATLERGVWRLDPAIAVPRDRDWLFINMPLQTTFLVNASLVKSGEEPKSYADLLEPKWKGKIALQRPWIGGTGSGWFRAVHRTLGLDYMRSLAQQVVLVANVNDSVDAVARGQYPVAIAASPQRVRQLISEGAPIRHVHPKEGSHMAANGIMLMADAPHLNASRLFLHWFYTREGQAIYAPNSLAISVRKDIPQDYLSPAERYVDGSPFLMPAAEDFTPKKSSELLDLAREIFESGK